MRFLLRTAVLGLLALSANLGIAQIDSRFPVWLRFDWAGQYPGAGASQTVLTEKSGNDQGNSTQPRLYLTGWIKPESKVRPAGLHQITSGQVLLLWSRQFKFHSGRLLQLRDDIGHLLTGVSDSCRIVRASFSSYESADPYWQYYQDCDKWGVVFQPEPPKLALDRDLIEMAFQRPICEQIVREPPIFGARRFVQFSQWIVEKIELGSAYFVSSLVSGEELFQYQEFLIVETPEYSWICLTTESIPADQNVVALVSRFSEMQSGLNEWICCHWSEFNCRARLALGRWQEYTTSHKSSADMKKASFHFAGYLKAFKESTLGKMPDGNMESKQDFSENERASLGSTNFECELWDAYCE